MIIEGRNAVSEALAGDVTIEKLCIQKGVFHEQLNRIKAAAADKKIKIVFCEKAAIDKLSLTGRHQGAVAVATEFAYADFEEMLDGRDASKPMLLVLLDGVEDPHNLGAVIRVAECAGADGIVIPKHRGAGVTDIAVKISAGASAHVKIAKVTNINDAVRVLKDRYVTVLAADAGGGSAYASDLTGDIAVIIGGEGKGVHALTKKLADGIISLPQLGKVNSLNASVAAGILLYEAVRQRRFAARTAVK